MSNTVIPAAFFESSGVDTLVPVRFVLNHFSSLVGSFCLTSYCYDILGMLTINHHDKHCCYCQRRGLYPYSMRRTQMVEIPAVMKKITAAADEMM